MPFFKKLLKYVTVASITTSTGWVCHQIYSTKNILNNALDVSILSENGGHEDNDLVIPPVNGDNPFFSTYDLVKLLLAKRLVKLAVNDKPVIRKGAVRGLSRIVLQDWQYEILASMINAEIAVGLARCKNINLKFFKEPPHTSTSITHDELVDRMRELLTKLYENSQHPCLGYFISEAFTEFHEHSSLEQESTPLELKRYIESHRDILFLSLESLLHHSSLERYGRDIIKFDGLPLLMDVYQQYKGTCNIEALICSIIANLTFHWEVRDDLFKTGWIKILAKWAKEETDLKLVLPTAKALSNLDRDENALFRSRLYLLHPTYRSSENFDADVIFVHGLLGGVFFTWRQRERLGVVAPLDKSGQKKHEDAFSYNAAYPTCPAKQSPISDPIFKDFLKDFKEHFNESICADFEIVMEDLPIDSRGDQSDGPFIFPAQYFDSTIPDDNCYTYCWPKDWLSDDFPYLRIIGVNYDTSLSMWAPICPSEHVKTLEQRSEELITQLSDAGIGKRPIIWICHSMGGILVKKLLLKAYNSQDKLLKNISLKTKGVVFYSTPHFGSSLAKLNPAIALLFWPSIEVQELQQNCPNLAKLHKDFVELTKKTPMEIISFVETKPTIISAMKFGVQLVEPSSANPGIGEYYEIPTDHLHICKPSSKCSFLYQKIYQVIHNVINENDGFE